MCTDATDSGICVCTLPLRLYFSLTLFDTCVIICGTIDSEDEAVILAHFSRSMNNRKLKIKS